MNQDVNPYASPAPKSDQATKAAVVSTGPGMGHLTPIVGVPYGVNILGLLEVFAAIGMLVGSAFLVNSVPRPLAMLGTIGGFVGIAAFDVWWRTRQPEVALWIRLLSPYTGGCFGYLPIWLVFPIGVMAAIIAVIVKLKYA